jgi:DNA repair protein RecO
MSHHIYTTSGFVLGSNSYGETGKFINIFTRELGLVSGTASGVRTLSSKLRYHIQDYNMATFSLVKGKEVWRITGAKEIENIKKLDKDKTIVYLKILNLLKRLLHGEEKNEELFDIVYNFFEYLSLNKVDSNALFCLESLTVFRILNNLGYIKSNQDLNNIVSSNLIDQAIIDIVEKNKKVLINEINRAIKESDM